MIIVYKYVIAYRLILIGNSVFKLEGNLFLKWK